MSNWQIVPLVPASTIGFAIISKNKVPTALGQTPFGAVAVNESVTVPVCPVAGV